jgi:acetylornithine deacetylase/succinyl-diaminopimelate desuccinylase-like protein
VLTGEPGYSVLYRTWARPTLEVHGMPGGFIGAGAKTVIPAKAAAKVSMRLVPNQDPDDILEAYTAFVKKLTPKGIETKIKVHSKGPACVVGTDNLTSRRRRKRCTTRSRRTGVHPQRAGRFRSSPIFRMC